MAGGRSGARPRREGEEFARRGDEDGTHLAKKPRFDPRNPSALVADAPEEDVMLEADEIGRRGQQTKRNAVNIDGYASDSSNEGFDARHASRPEKSQDEQQADMFADLEEKEGADDDDPANGGKVRKEVKFLDVDQIEGQSSSSRAGGRVYTDKGKGREEEDSESDVDDETRADLGTMDSEVGAIGKKEHAPRLDAFNMRSEQEEGRFDDQGNYVRKAVDPDAQHDQWLDGVSKKDMKRARQAAQHREDEIQRKQVAADAILTSDLLRKLLPLLQRGENVLEALARLGNKPKKKPQWQKNKSKDAMQLDQTDDDAPRRTTVEAITEAADQLLTRGYTDIYDTERERLVRLWTNETGEQWVDESAEPQWEYRWADARDGGDAHGPYSQKTMQDWAAAGYFGDGVEYRRTDSDWTSSLQD